MKPPIRIQAMALAVDHLMNNMFPEGVPPYVMFVGHEDKGHYVGNIRPHEAVDFVKNLLDHLPTTPVTPCPLCGGTQRGDNARGPWGANCPRCMGTGVAT